MRLDRFLVHSRIFKRRTVARRWVEEGKVLREGGGSLKPSTPVREGMILWIAPPRALQVKILSLDPLNWEVHPLAVAFPRSPHAVPTPGTPLDRLIPEEEIPFL